jgi:hypothetical protein
VVPCGLHAAVFHRRHPHQAARRFQRPAQDHRLTPTCGRVLAACAPSLHDAIDAARTAGDTHIGLDGTLIPTYRVKIEDPTEGCDFSGKHHRHGVNLQVARACLAFFHIERPCRLKITTQRAA